MSSQTRLPSSDTPGPPGISFIFHLHSPNLLIIFPFPVIQTILSVFPELFKAFLGFYIYFFRQDSGGIRQENTAYNT